MIKVIKVDCNKGKEFVGYVGRSHQEIFSKLREDIKELRKKFSNINVFIWKHNFLHILMVGSEKYLMMSVSIIGFEGNNE